MVKEERAEQAARDGLAEEASSTEATQVAKDAVEDPDTDLRKIFEKINKK